MSVVVTENWSGRKLSLRPPWTASRVFVVTGTTDESAALAAVDPTDSSVKVPQLNDVHPKSSRLLCTGPYVNECKSPEYWVIQADYAIPQAGEFPDISGDPLEQEMQILWESIEVNEAVDRDLGNRPIFNSAGFAFKNQVSRPMTYLAFKIERNEPYFDLSKFSTFAKQHLRCSTIYPSAPYTPSSSFVKMSYRFEVIPENLLGQYPFQHRIMDAGDDGRNANGPAKFENSDGEVVGDVRLNGLGTPLVKHYPDFTVAGLTPVGPPTETDVYDLETSADAVWLIYERVKVVDFSPLFPS